MGRSGNSKARQATRRAKAVQTNEICGGNCQQVHSRYVCEKNRSRDSPNEGGDYYSSVRENGHCQKTVCGGERGGGEDSEACESSKSEERVFGTQTKKLGCNQSAKRIPRPIGAQTCQGNQEGTKRSGENVGSEIRVREEVRSRTCASKNARVTTRRRKSETRSRGRREEKICRKRTRGTRSEGENRTRETTRRSSVSGEESGGRAQRTSRKSQKGGTSTSKDGADGEERTRRSEQNGGSVRESVARSLGRKRETSRSFGSGRS
mmetsp:Transcript_6578/g.19642  ORF Transcript_6578/g.19642 Transcript_6578/m.19642 type:complete len:264 (+) Transcript_6578:1058-1849(+)